MGDEGRMRGFQSLFCIFLRLSLCVCFLRYFLRCFLSSAVSLGVSFAWCLCVSMYQLVRFYVHFSVRFSLRFSLPFCFSLYISLHKEETGRRKQRKFLLSVWPYFRCSPKYGHFLYLNSKEETATHLRLYLRLLYITARKPVGLADLVDLVDLVSPVDAADLVDLSALSKPRFLH